MKNPFKMLNSVLLSTTAVLLPLLMQVSCKGGSGTGPDPDAATYQIQGTVVIDPNLLASETRVVARFFKDSTVLPDGDVVFGDDTLMFQTIALGQDSVWTEISDSLYKFVNSARQVSVSEPNEFSDNFIASVPDSFSILDIITPRPPIIQGLENLTYEWTGAARAETYVMAAVHSDSAYSEWGFSDYTENPVTAGTITPEAWTQTDGLNPDTGLYFIYVYAIAGIPDSALTSKILPVPLPSQLPGDNVNELDLIGRFGSIVVTLYDTVRVQTISTGG